VQLRPELCLSDAWRQGDGDPEASPNEQPRIKPHFATGKTGTHAHRCETQRGV